MSDNNADLEQRLAALEQGNPRHGPAPKRRSPILALGVAGLIAAGGTALYFLSQPEEEVALPTATPDEFQTEGDGFGEIEPFVPPPAPEPEVVFIEPEPAEPNAELLAQLAALQAQIEELKNAPEPVVEEDTAAAEAIDALTVLFPTPPLPEPTAITLLAFRPTCPNSIGGRICSARSISTSCRSATSLRSFSASASIVSSHSGAEWVVSSSVSERRPPSTFTSRTWPVSTTLRPVSGS